MKPNLKIEDEYCIEEEEINPTCNEFCHLKESQIEREFNPTHYHASGVLNFIEEFPSDIRDILTEGSIERSRLFQVFMKAFYSKVKSEVTQEDLFAQSTMNRLLNCSHEIHHTNTGTFWEDCNNHILCPKCHQKHKSSLMNQTKHINAKYMKGMQVTAIEIDLFHLNEEMGKSEIYIGFDGIREHMRKNVSGIKDAFYKSSFKLTKKFEIIPNLRLVVIHPNNQEAEAFMKSLNKKVKEFGLGLSDQIRVFIERTNINGTLEERANSIHKALELRLIDSKLIEHMSKINFPEVTRLGLIRLASQFQYLKYFSMGSILHEGATKVSRAEADTSELPINHGGKIYHRPDIDIIEEYLEFQKFHG